MDWKIRFCFQGDANFQFEAMVVSSEAPLTSAGVPDPQMYHTKQLFLWMPRKMWRIDFRCPRCTTPQYLRY